MGIDVLFISMKNIILSFEVADQVELIFSEYSKVEYGISCKMLDDECVSIYKKNNEINIYNIRLGNVINIIKLYNDDINCNFICPYKNYVAIGTCNNTSMATLVKVQSVVIGMEYVGYINYINNIEHITNCTNNLYIITRSSNGNDILVFKLKNKNFYKRINMLINKRLFNWCIKLCEVENRSDNEIKTLYKIYGDWLYNKPNYKECINAYCLAGNIIEPSYVIEKFITINYKLHLYNYLLYLHQSKLDNTIYTVLLVKCLQSLYDNNDTQYEVLLKDFISEFGSTHSEKIKLSLKYIRSSGAYEFAKIISLILKDELEYVDILIDDYNNFNDAFVHLNDTSNQIISSVILKHGRKLAKADREELLKLIHRVFKANYTSKTKLWGLSTVDILTAPPEVTTTSSTRRGDSSNSLPINGITTPGDRDGEQGMDWASCGVSAVPQVEPAADLREAEGEVNREAPCNGKDEPLVEPVSKTDPGGNYPQYKGGKGPIYIKDSSFGDEKILYTFDENSTTYNHSASLSIDDMVRIFPLDDDFLLDITDVDEECNTILFFSIKLDILFSDLNLNENKIWKLLNNNTKSTEYQMIALLLCLIYKYKRGANAMAIKLGYYHLPLIITESDDKFNLLEYALHYGYNEPTLWIGILTILRFVSESLSQLRLIYQCSTRRGGLFHLRLQPYLRPAVSFSIYLSLKSRATPRDRGEISETIYGSRGEVNKKATTASGKESSTGPQVEPAADLREAEGEINEGAVYKTTSGGVEEVKVVIGPLVERGILLQNFLRLQSTYFFI